MIVAEMYPGDGKRGGDRKAKSKDGSVLDKFPMVWGRRTWSREKPGSTEPSFQCWLISAQQHPRPGHVASMLHGAFCTCLHPTEIIGKILQQDAT
jgi:hypothetical protein